MQWQQPACNASFCYICRGDRRRSHGPCMWRQQLAFTAWGGICRHTDGGSRILWQWPTGCYACFSWHFGYPTIVEKVTTITCNTFNRYGSVAPWVSWGGICRVDIPAAGCAFCDSDLQAVMRVSLAFLICHDRWKGHHNCRQQTQSLWQRSAMGQLVWLNFGFLFIYLCHSMLLMFLIVFVVVHFVVIYLFIYLLLQNFSYIKKFYFFVKIKKTIEKWRKG